MVETAIAVLIPHMIFDVVPMICMLAGLGFMLGHIRYPELDDEPVCIAWHEEVIPTSFVAAPKNETIALDALQCLFDDMETCGVELAFITVADEAPLVVLEDDSMDVDVSEFSEACDPISAPAMMILSVDDKQVAAAAKRDGLCYADTIAELPEPVTEVIYEADDSDIKGMVAEIMKDSQWLDAGSDESTFFESTVWKEETIFSDTIIDRRIEC